MKVFVWERIKYASDSFHTEGGVVVFAKNLERAMELAEKENVKWNGESPDDVRKVFGGIEAVYIMPDAGCC